MIFGRSLLHDLVFFMLSCLYPWPLTVNDILVQDTLIFQGLF